MIAAYAVVGLGCAPGEACPREGPDTIDMEELTDAREAMRRAGSSAANCMARRDRLLPLLLRLCILPAGEGRAVPPRLTPRSLRVSSSMLLLENCETGENFKDTRTFKPRNSLQSYSVVQQLEPFLAPEVTPDSSEQFAFRMCSYVDTRVLLS